MKCSKCKTKMSVDTNFRWCLTCGRKEVRIPGTHRWTAEEDVRMGSFIKAKPIVEKVMRQLEEKKVKKDTAKCRTCTYFETTVCSSGCMMDLQVESCGGPFDGEEGMSNQEVFK